MLLKLVLHTVTELQGNRWKVCSFYRRAGTLSADIIG
jgi:hypothetical protein